MNSIYDFIITPTNSRYNNKIKVGDKTLIVNSNIEDHKMVSRHATVLSVPLAYKFDIKKGDEIIIHHNILEDGMMLEVMKEIVVNTLKKIYISVSLIKYTYIKEAKNGYHLWIDVL